jgi:phosphate transport system permease protein
VSASGSTVRQRPEAVRRVRRFVGRKTSLFANGEPWVWLTGGALAIAGAMIVGLLGLVLWYGIGTFWPQSVVALKTADGKQRMGEITARERFEPDETSLASWPASVREHARAAARGEDGKVERRLLRTGNYELTGEHFAWVPQFAVEAESRPEWAIVVERLTWGRFYGTPKAVVLDGSERTGAPEEVWALFEQHHGTVRERWRTRRALETDEIGQVNARIERARLDLKALQLSGAKSPPEVLERAQARFEEVEQEAQRDFERISTEIRSIDELNERFQLVLETCDARVQRLAMADIVRAYPANRLGILGRLEVYLSRWAEYLTDEPREANSEGGVLPAIFGTAAMTLLMTLAVVPFGVLAALFLREYARPGPIVSIVRIAVNNLAGVPSIVFGVFGLGFFCYIVGASIDEAFFAANLPNPTFGKGGILWASLTLALLTLPVVIVPTEEALAAVPSSMREGSYACGATKWQTIRRIVLPKAMPGILTGMILAMARGAGEVAPLMLVGAVKLAPKLPIDGEFPYVHGERSFMHLGFHIYDLGFQSQNSEAAKPMVFTTTLVLIALVVTLNLIAIWIRARLRRRYQGTHV